MVIESLTLSTSAQRLGALTAKFNGIIGGEVHLQSAAANTGITIFIGNSDVTTSKGYELAPGGVLRVSAGDVDAQAGNLYAIASSGTPRLNIVVQEA
jgi:hypothetical protein